FLYMKAVNSVDGYVCQEKERASFAGYRLGVRCRLASVEDSDLNQTQAAGEGEMTEPVTMLGTTQPMTVMRPSSGSNAPPPMGRQPSYHPTRWPQVNRLLDLADTLTGGHAKWVQRTFNYLLFGGFAALVNLVLITFIYKGVKLSVDRHVHYAIA